MANNLNSFPHKDVIEEIEKALVDELSKSIDEEIILDIFSPETKGLAASIRRKTIQRNQKIDQILGIDSSVSIGNEIEVNNFSEGTVDIKNHFEKKTFKLVSDFTKAGYVWAPWIISHSVPVIIDGSSNSKLISKYSNVYIDPNLNTNI